MKTSVKIHRRFLGFIDLVLNEYKNNEISINLNYRYIASIFAVEVLETSFSKPIYFKWCLVISYYPL